MRTGSMRARARSLTVASLILAALALPRWSSATLAAPVILTPAQGSVQSGISPAKVKISGTAASGSTVEVFETLSGRGSLGTATAAGDQGSWSLLVALPAGAFAIHAIASDGAGNVSLPSEVVSFEVDAERPGVSVATEDRTVFPPGQPATITGGATDERAVFAVLLEYWLLDKVALRELASCADCGTGTSVSWSHSPNLKIPALYAVKIWSYDAAGNRSMPAGVSFVTSGVNQLPVTPPAAPPPPEILIPQDGSTQPAAGGRPVTIGGTAPPGTAVRVFETLDGVGRLGETTAGAGDGRLATWSITTRLTGGTYGVYAVATDPNGTVYPASTMVTFIVDDRAPALGVATQTVTPVYLPGQPVRISGEADDDRSLLAVQLEYWLLDDLVLRANAICPSCPTSDRAVWVHYPDLPGPGYYHVKVTAIDLAGNKSPSSAVTFVATV